MPTTMVVEFDAGQALSLDAARKGIRGKDGKPAHKETVRRYVTRGAKVPGGQVVKLKATRLGGEWVTMPGWVEDFERARLIGGMG